jgi:phage tail-like protein
LSAEAGRHGDGGDPSPSHKSSHRTEFDAVTLERGVTHDLDFERWANNARDSGAEPNSEVSRNNFRKDIVIEIYNEADELTIAYKVYRCWVSKYQALPNVNANANAVAIEHIRLENEGWELTRFAS